MDDHVKAAYTKAEEIIKKGYCPVCNSALCDDSYCPTHGFLKSHEGSLVENESYDTKLLEFVIGCN